MKNIALLLLVACTTVACRQDASHDEEILWNYYKGFTTSPALCDSLASKSKQEANRNFLLGLRCFEKYEQFDSVSCYDSSRLYFKGLITTHPENYLGYLGMGILLTERGMKARGSDPHHGRFMDSAEYYYARATQQAPRHPAVFYYRGRNQYQRNRDSINIAAIQYLDTATILKPNFFKAIERSAEYLSHYLDLAADPEHHENAKDFKSRFPNLEERVKYLFNQSLQLDNSWHETYQGIARAAHVYSNKERIDFLKTGIAIAKSRKSKDSLSLMRYLANVYFYDLKDYETAASLFNELRLYRELAWISFYNGNDSLAAHYFHQSMKKSQDAETLLDLAHFHRHNHRLDSAQYYLAAARRSDTFPNLEVDFETAKLSVLMDNRKEAEQQLIKLIQTYQEQMGEEAELEEGYQKALALLSWLQSG